MFSKGSFPEASKGVIVWEWVKLNNKISAMAKLKAFADDKFNVTKIMIHVLEMLENIVGKGENAGYHAFSPFLIIFSKALYFRVVKNQDCVGKS